MSEHLCLPRRTAAEAGVAPQRKRSQTVYARHQPRKHLLAKAFGVLGWIVNIYWQQAFGPLLEEWTSNLGNR